MDLPFLNNAPAGAPATPGAPQGGDFWGGGEAGSNDDATLNDLLALYQTANEPAAPPFAEPTALAEPAFAPPPFAQPAMDPPPFAQAPMADPFAASADPFAMPGADAEIDELIKSFQAGPAATEPPMFQAPADPMFAAPPAEPMFAAPPAEPVFAAPPAEPVFAAPPAEPMFAAPPAEPVFAAPPAEPVFAAPPAEPVFAPAPEPVFAAPPAEPVFTPPAPVMAPVVAPAPQPMAAPQPAMESMRMATIPQAPAMPVDIAAGTMRLATSEERQAAMQNVVSAVNQLTTGIEQIQGQLATLYEGLAHAAAHRAPVTEIVTLTEQLTATKSQAGENSPLWQQAMVIRQMADSYLQMLKTL